MTKQPVTVSVTGSVPILLTKEPVPFEELEAALQAKLAGFDQPTVVLRFDQELSVQDLVDVLTIGNRLKVKMVLTTQMPSGA